MPKQKLPLSEVFEQIGMDTCVLLMKESAHLEPLARRFDDEFHRLPKRQRNPRNAAQVVVDYGLDVNAVRNLLVKLYSRHMQSLARVKQASMIGEITDVSMEASTKEANFEERKPHMIKHGIIDSEKTGINLELNQQFNQQNFGLPSFENTITRLEDKMRERQALNPATQPFVDAEFETAKEKVPA